MVTPEMSRRRVVLAVAGLGLGLLFYLGYRSDYTVSNRMLRWICGQPAYEHFQHAARYWLPVPGLLRGCLPSALWCLIGTSLLGGWKMDLRPGWTLPLAGMCPWFNTGWEMVQWLGWTDGRGDVLDVIAGIAGYGLAQGAIRGSAKLVPISFSWNWRLGVIAMAIGCIGFADVWR
jgi:hypothetical protein